MKPVPRYLSNHRFRFRRPALAAAAAIGLAVSLLALAAPGAQGAARAATAGRTSTVAGHKESTANCPWLDQSLPIATRVNMVLSQMTLADEITMVEGQGTSQPYVFYMAAQPSLCIPAMGLEDGPVGVGDGLTGVTELPSAVSLASTFDTSLAHSYGRVIGNEEWGKGAAVNLGPTINIDRDPRWGRSFEAFTEDPFLNSALAVSEINGVQSTGEMSQVKHFAVYNQETNRNSSNDDSIVSTRTLHEIYFPGFQASVSKAHAGSVMCSYAVINGSFACNDAYLLSTVLRGQFHFPGFVTSDYAALHSTQGAVEGDDMEQPFNQFYGSALQQAVQNGQIAKSVVDQMCSRILTEMFRFNLFNSPPTGNTGDTVTTSGHQAVGTKVAEEGTVLLKNDGTLPLPASNGGTVAVIGPAASTQTADTGGGSAFVTAPFSVTPLQGLTSAAGPGTNVVYQQGLPDDSSLAAIPSSDLSPAYSPTPFGGSYTGTLTAPETGTYVLGMTNPCGCYTGATLSLNGTTLFTVPSTPPVHTYSASVQLVKGQTYTLAISGDTSALTWATPSDLAPGIGQAVAAARAASSAVVVVSDDTETEAADRTSLSLPSAQNQLVSAVAAANPHTVVVVDAGAPVAMPWLSKVAAVVYAWYPGESNGTALASVLYGGTDPSGHLPVTFPKSLAQVPAASPQQFPGVNGTVDYSEGIDVGYRWYNAKNLTPMFPFGFGLSYTRFGYSGLTVTPAGSGLTVTATVTNTGSVAGSDVAQLYLGDPAGTGEPPRQLKGFSRVTLNPGQSTTVSFGLGRHDLAYWSTKAHGWSVANGTYQLYTGDSSALADLPLRNSFVLIGGKVARHSA